MSNATTAVQSTLIRKFHVQLICIQSIYPDEGIFIFCFPKGDAGSQVCSLDVVPKHMRSFLVPNVHAPVPACVEVFSSPNHPGRAFRIVRVIPESCLVDYMLSVKDEGESPDHDRHARHHASPGRQ